MRTLKEELVCIYEWKNPVEFIEALNEWVKKYNYEYLRSALQYQMPVAYNQQQEAHSTQLQSA